MSPLAAQARKRLQPLLFFERLAHDRRRRRTLTRPFGPPSPRGRGAGGEGGFKRLGEPEIEHLGGALPCDLDVGGLQVTMDDATLVRVFQRFSDLPGDVERFIKL